MRVIGSALFWIYISASLCVWWFAVLIPWLLITPFDKRRRFAHWYAYTWANHFHAISPYWKIRLRGEDKIDPDKAYVLTANHESSADILLIYRLKKQYRWVSKTANFFIPFLGWMMWMAGYVGISRGHKASREKMLADCKRQLDMGNSIMIFPEGTRSDRDDLMPFKRGAFVIACENKVPIVPVVLAGTREILPRDAYLFTVVGRAPAYMDILDPIDPAQFDYDAKEMAKAVRKLMREHRNGLREELSEYWDARK